MGGRPPKTAYFFLSQVLFGRTWAKLSENVQKIDKNFFNFIQNYSCVSNKQGALFNYSACKTPGHLVYFMPPRLLKKYKKKELNHKKTFIKERQPYKYNKKWLNSCINVGNNCPKRTWMYQYHIQPFKKILFISSITFSEYNT